MLDRSTTLSAEVFECGLALIRLALVCFAASSVWVAFGVGMSTHNCVQLTRATP